MMNGITVNDCPARKAGSSKTNVSRNSIRELTFCMIVYNLTSNNDYQPILDIAKAIKLID